MMLAAMLRKCTFVVLLAALVLMALVSSSAHAQTDITNRQVTVGSLTPGTSVRYFANCTTAGQTIVVVLTAVIGEPDMYYSRTTQYPSPTDNQGSSTQDGSDVFSITNCVAGPYYVAVFSTDSLYPASYTILSQVYAPENPQNSPRTLVTSSPQNDALGAATWRYFVLNVTANTSNLNLYLMSRVGDPDMYILYSTTNNIATYYPTTSRYTWSSTAWGSDLLAIPNAAAGYYFIGIYAYTAVSYQLSAAVAEQALVMADGQTYGRQIPQGQYVYYSFRVTATNSAADLYFITTALSGDPDLYISRTNQRPNITNYEWRSISASAIDVIILYGALGEVQAGTYYIGVYGWSAARLTLMASLKARVNLLAGTAAVGVLAANDYRIYQLDAPVNTAVDWTVTSVTTYGTATIYLGTNPRIDPDDRSTWTYQSSWLSSSTQSINVPGTFCTTPLSNVTNSCRMYVLVYSPQVPAAFQIVAVASNAYTQVVPSLPTSLTAVAANQYRFYRFNVALQYANITVQVTPSSGNPDLFVGRTRPITPGNAIFSSTAAAGADRVIVRYNDPRLEGNGVYGTWYVAVYGTSAATFTLLVTVNDTSASVRPVTLALGSVQRAVVAYQDTNFYRVTLTRVNNVFPTLYVSVTPVSGDPDLVVFNEVTGLSQMGANAGGELITISPTSTLACSPTNATCPFTLRVYGWSRSDYVIVASTSGGLSLVSNRVSVQASTASRTWAYYMFINPSPSSNAQMELVFSLSQLFGNPDLYISTVFPPTAANAQWSSANAVGGDFVTISPVAATNYYVGVYANSSTLATFSLYSDLYNKSAPELSPVTLWLGGTVQGAASLRSYRYYTVTLFSPARYLFISLNALIGDPDLYVTSTQLDGTSVWPTLAYSRWSALVGGSDFLYIPSPNATTYRIGVYSYSASLYQLSVTTTSTRPLSDGTSITGAASPSSPAYFSFNLPQLVANSSLQFSITPLAGNPDIFVSRSLSELEAGRSTWNSTQSTGIDLVRIGANAVAVGTYYIKVNGSSASSFQIIASYSQPRTLLDGLTQYSYARTGELQYYRVSYQGPLQSAVTISATPTYGIPYLYVTTQAGVEPLPTLYDYRDETPLATTHSVTIPTSRCATATVCTFNILVLGSQATYYGIASSTLSSYSVISAGASVSGSLAASTAQFFRFSVASEFSNVTLLLRATSGNPDLFVRRTRPVGLSEYDWSSTNSTSFGIDVVYFDWTSPLLTSAMNTYTFYVAVYARTQSTFTLTLSVADASGSVRRALAPNVEQAGYVRQGVYDYYSLSLTGNATRNAVTFFLFALSGDPDLTVTCPETGGSWSSSFGGTNTDSVTLTPGSTGVCTRNATNLNVPCVYYVNVYGYTTSSYVLAARPVSTEVRLYSGVSQTVYGLAQGSWRNYMFADADPLSAKTLSFIVTPISGNPDLYVSTIGRPTVSSYNWSSTTTNEEYVSVGRPTDRVYWVAVRSAGPGVANFSIMADYFDSTNPQASAITLSAWSAQNALLDERQWRYFEFATPSSGFTHVSFTAIATSGNPDLYVNSQVLSNLSFPTSTRSDYSSANSGSDLIVLNRAVVDTYRIGVYAQTRTFATVAASYATVVAIPAVGAVRTLSSGTFLADYYRSFEVAVTGNSFTLTLNTNDTVWLLMSHLTILPASGLGGRVSTSRVDAGADRTFTLSGVTTSRVYITMYALNAGSSQVTFVSYSGSAVVPISSSAGSTPVTPSSSTVGPIVRPSSSASAPVDGSTGDDEPVAASSGSNSAVVAGVVVPLVVVFVAAIAYYLYRRRNGAARSTSSFNDNELEMNPYSRSGGKKSSRLLDDSDSASGSDSSEGSYAPPSSSRRGW